MWIKCSDQMPPPLKHVLVNEDNWVHEAALSRDGTFWHDGDYSVRLGDVTHWMPMPEPPAT